MRNFMCLNGENTHTHIERERKRKMIKYLITWENANVLKIRFESLLKFQLDWPWIKRSLSRSTMTLSQFTIIILRDNWNWIIFYKNLRFVSKIIERNFCFCCISNYLFTRFTIFPFYRWRWIYYNLFSDTASV